jgi:hypothetical protein
LEGSGSGLTEILSRHLLGGFEQGLGEEEAEDKSIINKMFCEEIMTYFFVTTRIA